MFRTKDECAGFINFTAVRQGDGYALITGGVFGVAKEGLGLVAEMGKQRIFQSLEEVEGWLKTRRVSPKSSGGISVESAPDVTPQFFFYEQL